MARTAQAIKSAADTVRQFGQLRVAVTGGAHSGIVHSGGRRISVGSDGDNDVVLFADHLQAHHLSIEGAENFLSTPRIRSLDGAIEVDGTALFPGEAAPLREGTVVAADRATLVVSRIGYPRDLRQLALRAALVGVAIAAMLVGLSLVKNLAIAATSFGAGVVATVGASARSAPALPTSAALRTGEANVGALDAARQRLGELGLGPFVQLSAAADGSLQAAGEAPAQSKAAWTSFLSWYDSTGERPVLIRNATVSDGPPTYPKLASVWLNAPATVYFADGASARQGELGPDGWRVVGIAEAGVLIERNGAQVTLSF